MLRYLNVLIIFVAFW